jgi:hypothetical protein
VKQDVENVVEALIDDEVRCVELVDDLTIADDLTRENAASDKTLDGQQDAAFAALKVHSNPP